MNWLSIFVAPVTSLISNVVGYFKHSADMKEATRQKELAIEQTKVEIAKQAENAEQLATLEQLQQPLGDRGFRKFLVIVISLPLIMLLPDLVGYSQFGSEIVNKYFDLVERVIPLDYRIFLVTCVGGYFGIAKVRETFFKGK